MAGQRYSYPSIQKPEQFYSFQRLTDVNGFRVRVFWIDDVKHVHDQTIFDFDQYLQPWQIALRKLSGDVCRDPECTLSGGYAHAGECLPCRCGYLHAVDECPKNYEQPGKP